MPKKDYFEKFKTATAAAAATASTASKKNENIQFKAGNKKFKDFEAIEKTIDELKPEAQVKLLKELELSIDDQNSVNLLPLFEMATRILTPAAETAIMIEPSVIEIVDENGKKYKAALFYNLQVPMSDWMANFAVKVFGVKPECFEYVRFARRGKTMVPVDYRLNDVLGKWDPE